ncbi:DEP domain-containing protein [Chamaesiphon sp.]|uniref:DEP domain-containing protein n=1 Tax=Chamaesiphon sp. TaxID=2814140 RepID=UPI0035938F70
MILKSQDVSYCQLVRQFGTISEIVSGVNYQGNLFVRGNSYPQQQRQSAITEMRRSYLDPEPAAACLLVEDGEMVIIWYEDRHIVKVVDSAQDLVKYFNLAQLVQEMRSPQGVKIENRSQSFRLPYLRCFIGREAVDWMCNRLAISRLQSVELGQRLITDNWLTNLSNQQPFEDSDFFYQFCMDK